MTSANFLAPLDMLVQLGASMSAWLLYNGFNYPLNHYETKLLPEEVSRIDKRVLGVIEKTLALIKWTISRK